MPGHDLEHSNEALAVTNAILKIKPTHYPRIVETIFTVALKCFDLFNYLATDKYPMCELIRIQSMLKAFQIRSIAVVELIEAMLGIAVNIIPKDMDKIRIHETVMRSWMRGHYLLNPESVIRITHPSSSEII